MPQSVRRLAAITLLLGLTRHELPARAADDGGGAAAVLSWRLGPGQGQLRDMRQRLVAQPVDVGLRGLVALVAELPARARLTMLLGGAMMMRSKDPDANADCPKAGLRVQDFSGFELRLLSERPKGCTSAGGAALWSDDHFEKLEADARRAEVVAWMKRRPGAAWASADALGKADWISLVEGQVTAETLRALARHNGLSAADQDNLEQTLRSMGDTLPETVGAARAVALYNTTTAVVNSDPASRLRLLEAGVSEALKLDGHDIACAAALRQAFAGAAAAGLSGLDTCPTGAAGAPGASADDALAAAFDNAVKAGTNPGIRAAWAAWAVLDAAAVLDADPNFVGAPGGMRELIEQRLIEALKTPA